MTRTTLRIVALAAAAIAAISLAAADGDHSTGYVTPHLREHVATAQAALDVAQASITTILAVQAVVTAQASLTSASATVVVLERALRFCTRDNNCTPSGMTGSEIDALTIGRTVESSWRASLATARDTAAAAIDSDSDGDETWGSFVATRTRAKAALTSAQTALARYLLNLRWGRVNDAPSGRCRVNIEALPENRRFHVWSSGSVCWDRNGDGDFNDAGELGSLLLIK